MTDRDRATEEHVESGEAGRVESGEAGREEPGEADREEFGEADREERAEVRRAQEGADGRKEGTPEESRGTTAEVQGAMGLVTAGPSADEAAQAAADAAIPPRPVSLEERFSDRTTIRLPCRHNPVLAGLVERVNQDDELYALWVAANVNAVDRLHISDHGPVHVQIVANCGLRLLRLLIEAGVTPGVVADYGMDRLDAEVVVALAALFHDVGMSIHREGHESYSLFVAGPPLERLLAHHYEPARATVLRSEILHAIIAHRAGGVPLTLEAGVLRIADALDMEQGRSRIPFRTGSTSIHSVSAAAIEAVHIERGESTPVRIRIEMSNSAGVYQVDELLRNKLRGSGLEGHIQVEALIASDTEKRIVSRFQL